MVMKKENEQPKIEVKKHRSIVYRYYDCLKKNHYGKENGISRDNLAKEFNINIQTQKKILAEINNSDVFDKLISTSRSIYMCKTKKECEEAYFNEIKSGLARLLKGKKMADKVMHNNQYKIKYSKEMKDILETFENS